MPADLSPPRRRYDDGSSSRQRSRSPRRDDRDRDRSPPRYVPKKPKELSMYKKSGSSYGPGGGGASSGSTGSFASRRDPLDRMPARDRERERESQDVPGRYGGQRGSAGGSRGYDRDREERSSGRGGYGDARGAESRGYRDGESLQRVRTRDERDDRRDGGKLALFDLLRFGRSLPDTGYRDGDSLSRVKTRDERDARGGAAEAAGFGKTPAVGEAVQVNAAPMQYTTMIEIIANDRLGRKVRVKCSPLDTVGDLKKLIAAQTGTPASKIQLKKWYSTFKDHITLRDYEINDGMSLEMY